jgi:hypothetical protein
MIEEQGGLTSNVPASKASSIIITISTSFGSGLSVTNDPKMMKRAR